MSRCCKRLANVCTTVSSKHGSYCILEGSTNVSYFHFSSEGKFVSESKFRSAPAAFIPHILNPNREALAALITKPEVELKLLHRVRNKARLYGQDFGPDGQPLSFANGGKGTNGLNGANGTTSGGESPVSPVSVGFPGGKIDVDSVVELYEHYIIPLTKEVEVSFVLFTP